MKTITVTLYLVSQSGCMVAVSAADARAACETATWLHGAGNWQAAPVQPLGMVANACYPEPWALRLCRFTDGQWTPINPRHEGSELLVIGRVIAGDWVPYNRIPRGEWPTDPTICETELE